MSFPNLSFWSNLLGSTGIEVCVVVALGIAAQSAFRLAWWKRAMWQMTLLCLILVFASEWTGAGRGAVWSIFGPKRANRAVVPPTLSPNVEFNTLKGTYTVSPPPLAPNKTVWWPGWAWLAGTVLVLGRMATAQCLLLVLRFRREKIVDDNLQERVNRIASMLGLRRNICLLRLPESISPMAFGVLLPTVGLPPEFETVFSAAEQDAILAHELAHLVVHDPLWFRLADFASALLWWHPLAWWARRSLHATAELAADEATALVPEGPESLAHCLVSLGKKMTVSRGWGWTGINGGFRSKLGKRVERLTRMSAGVGSPFVGWRDRVVKIAATVLVVPSVVLLFGAFQTARGERETGLRDSWNRSPGMLLAMAALDTTETPMRNEVNKEEIATPITDAKLLYEMGNLKESKAILMQIIKDDPANAKAAYYLNLIKEAQFMERARARTRERNFDIFDITPIPLAKNTDPHYDKTERTPAFDQPLAPLNQPPPPQATPEPAKAETLHTKAFPLNSEFKRNVLSQVRFILNSDAEKADDTAQFNKLLQVYFANAGAKLTTPDETIDSDDRASMLIVRATEEKLQVIEQAIGRLNTVTPQVTVESKFVDLSQEDARALGYNAFLEESNSNLTSVLTAAQYDVALNGIKQNSQGKTIAAPRITTLSGRQAHVASAEGDDVAALDVIPTVLADGYSIHMLLIPTYSEFIGNDPYGAFIFPAQSATGTTKNNPTVALIPVPHFRLRQALSNCNVQDGETIVTGQMITRPNSNAKKLRLVLVTPTIIDPSGNRVHSDQELSEKRHQTP